MADVRLKWGHKVFDPDGKPVQLPAKALVTLRRLGLLEKNRDLGGMQISPRIHLFLTAELDALTDGLRRSLGTNLEGPTVVLCPCRACKRKWAELLAQLKDGLEDFHADMQVQGSAE